MDCLWCNKQIVPEINWDNLFILSIPKSLCNQCDSELEMLLGNRCSRCSCVSEEAICSDCKWWEKHLLKDPLTFNYSALGYNAFMQDVIAKWKYRGDYVLGTMFKQHFIQAFKEKFTHLKKDALAVPIPLSNDRLLDRGFNQAKVLADFIPLDSKEVISRVHGEKQAKKTRQERIFTKNPFSLTETINIPVILVDDIYTTGTTLRHAGALLKAHGCPEVYAITLVRG